MYGKGKSQIAKIMLTNEINEDKIRKIIGSELKMAILIPPAINKLKGIYT